MLKNFVFFVFLVFSVPSCVLATKLWFFGTLQGFGKIFQSNIAKTEVLAALLLRNHFFVGSYEGCNLLSKVLKLPESGFGFNQFHGA